MKRNHQKTEIENFADFIKQHNAKKIVSNSEHVDEDSGFIAICGKKHDGNKFIEEAALRGAKFILTDSEIYFEKYRDLISSPIYLVDDTRKAESLCYISLMPDAPSNLFAVTGTNGKSSTVDFIFQLLKLQGLSSSCIGTLGVKLWNEKIKTEEQRSHESGLTTFSAKELAETLSYLSKCEIDYCAMEASSIGLDQERLHGRIFKAAGFSSFSQDHLDYHSSMKEYLECKLKLFSENCSDESTIVINNDMPEFGDISSFLQKIKRPFITYGKQNADFQYSILEQNISGQRFILKHENAEYDLSTKILGEFQVANIILSLAMLSGSGFGLQDIAGFVSELNAPEGRLERVGRSGLAQNIFVDYAHTPDALEKVLIELKQIANMSKRKLICIFGCGGDRDKSKRGKMGIVASGVADKVIITDDNPRTEDPSQIRGEILQYCKNALEEGDRQKAIKLGIDLMEEGDILLIAGKGHESYQIIGSEKFPFDDKKVACDILAQDSILRSE
ncbi:MAG: UDP-N-acetylmuramoyl-L-alanyl-D-glutamate--2,6-diaminopimelate ligase [Rickettsiaceae bacterium]|nr:UDP-N-acetylmuramoyl-L-alanyl-D-glutamate--2,6-diaminopimelate ligase [Rickettsiaceae bacterium]